MFEEYEMAPSNEDEPSDENGFNSNVIQFAGPFPKQMKSKEDTHLEDRVKASIAAGTRKVTSVIDVMEDDEKLSFVLQGLLPDTGLMYIGGLSGTGKTILAIQIGGNITLGRPTMTWTLGEAVGDDFKTLLLSLEMPKKELQLRLQHIYPNISDDDKKVFQNRFLTYCEPEPIKLWDPKDVVDLIRMIQVNKVNLVIIDSASVSFAQSLNDDKQVNESLANLQMIRVRLNVAMIIVSHTRKPPAGIASRPEDITLNELFGHSGVAQSASAILIVVEDEQTRKDTIRNNRMHDTEKVVHIINAKARFDANGGSFKAFLTSKESVESGSPLEFKRNAIPIAAVKSRGKAKSGPKIDLSSTLKGISFGALGGMEEEDDDGKS